MFFVRRVALSALFFSLLLLVSCGGHNEKNLSASRKGKAQFLIQWPEQPTRLIPLGSASIRVTLSGPTNAVQTVDRPSGGSNTSEVVFPDLAPGDYSATATAYPNADATGTAQASGTTPLTITDDQTTSTPLTMGSTIARVELSLSGPARMGVGASRTIIATAKSATNATVLVHPSQWEWQNSNSADFTFSPGQNTATISAQHISSTTVMVKDKESLVTNAVAITSDGIQFEGLGDLPGGEFLSNAFSVSGDGKVITGRGTVKELLYDQSLVHGFRWTAETGMIDLFPLSPSQNGFVYAISKSGNAIVGFADGGGTFEWTLTEGLKFIGASNGITPGLATGTSQDGQVIVGSGSSVRGAEAFRWTSSTGLVSLGDLPGGAYYSYASACSQDGNSVVGFSYTEPFGGERAFYWTPSTGMIRLSGLSDGDISKAIDISDNGEFVTGEYYSSVTNIRTFRWSQAQGVIRINDLPGGSGDTCTPTGITEDGSVIIGMGIGGAGEEPFLWTEARGTQSLHDFLRTNGVDLTGWQTLYVNDISADGKTIVGGAWHGDHIEAFRIYKPDGFQNP